MSLRISGKNLDVGDAFRSQVETRLNEALKKYFDGGFTGRVTLEREGSGFRTLHEGETVEFEERPGERGVEAAHVVKL